MKLLMMLDGFPDLEDFVVADVVSISSSQLSLKFDKTNDAISFLSWSKIRGVYVI